MTETLISDPAGQRRIAAEPLVLTDEARRIIEEAIVELGGLVDVGPADPPPIFLIEISDLPPAMARRAVWALFGRNPEPVIMVQRGLPPVAFRAILRHELAHWWQELAGLSGDEGFPNRFGRDARFHAAMRAQGLIAPPGWTYRLERDGRGTIGWHMRRKRVQLNVHRGADAEGKAWMHVPDSASGAGVLDSDETHEVFFIVPDRIYVVVEAPVWLRFRQFVAPAKAASSGGGSTSGASSATSATEVELSLSMSTEQPHVHSNPEGGSTGLGNGGGSFVVDIDPHTHGIAHTHTTPAHTHGLDYGIFKEPMPGSIDVNLGVYRKDLEGGAWQLLASVSGIDQEEIVIDLEEVVDLAPGLWRLTLQSGAGQPQGGRLTVDVIGNVLGAIQSS